VVWNAAFECVWCGLVQNMEKLLTKNRVN